MFQDPNLKEAYAKLVAETQNEFQHFCDVVDAAYPDGAPDVFAVEYANSKGQKDAETALAEERAAKAAEAAEAAKAAKAAETAEPAAEGTEGTEGTEGSEDTEGTEKPSEAVPFGSLVGRPWQYFVYGTKAYQISNKPGTIRSKDEAGAWVEQPAADVLTDSDLVVPVTKAEIEKTAA